MLKLIDCAEKNVHMAVYGSIISGSAKGLASDLVRCLENLKIISSAAKDILHH